MVAVVAQTLVLIQVVFPYKLKEKSQMTNDKQTPNNKHQITSKLPARRA